MNMNDLKPGMKCKATCFNGATCTFLGVVEACGDGSALVSVEHRGKLYLASNHQLSADGEQ